MMTDNDRLPGEPPLLRNWQPATTIGDYLRNCREGLEEYSDRRAAKLMGCPRIQLYRAKLMAELPDDLFEELLAAGVTSSKALAQVALALKRDDPRAADVEHCPNCGGVLRIRHHVNLKALKAIAKLMREPAVMEAAE
jgi:hypothetical protein